VPLANQQELGMRIAITTSGENLDAPLDRRFGRAPKFVIYYMDHGAFYIKHNEPNLNTAHGAGIQAALHLCDEKVSCVITGNCGPKAYEILRAVGIAVYHCTDITVRQAIEKLKRKELDEIQKANVDAHWTQYGNMHRMQTLFHSPAA